MKKRINKKELREQIIGVLRDCRAAADERSCDKCGFCTNGDKHLCRFYRKAKARAVKVMKIIEEYQIDPDAEIEQAIKHDLALFQANVERR